jgi:hypothetical protein
MLIAFDTLKKNKVWAIVIKIGVFCLYVPQMDSSFFSQQMAP